MMTAARLPARREPANSQFERPSATGRMRFSIRVDRQVAVVDVTYQRLPALEAVIDRLRARRSVGHLQAVDDEPLVQEIGDGPGALRAQPRPADRIEVLLACLAFDLVEFAEQLQRFDGEFTAMVGVELVELAPGVRLIGSAG